MDFAASNIVYLLTENWFIVVSIVTVTGVLLLTPYMYFAAVVCKSKARLDGKTVIITGGNTGIGKETARDLARRGARVVIACRDMRKAEAAAEDIRTDTGNKNVDIIKLDLACLKSVRECADYILKTEERIDILINNAGIGWCPFARSADGYELQFAVNHLGHFYLTNLLLEKIKGSAPARIVNVSSVAHTFVLHKLDLDRLNDERGYFLQQYQGYHHSKLLNILFSRELSKRLKGTGVTTNALHPGSVDTEISRNSMLLRVLKRIFSVFFLDTKAGAQTTIYCAVADELEGVTGKYFSDCAMKEESKQAQDDDLALRTWEFSEKLIAQSQK